VGRPPRDPAALLTGIVHLGVGAFARAHLAAYTQPLLARDSRWGILGVSLRRADTRDALEPQDFLYTLSIRDGNGERLEVLGPLTGILVAPEDPAALVARMAAPDVRIVSLTITEKGYHRESVSGALDEADAGIRHDLQSSDRPRDRRGSVGSSAARAPRRRPCTIHRVILRQLAFQRRRGASLAARAVRRPAAAQALGLDSEDAVVLSELHRSDRIVPATTEADRARISQNPRHGRPPGRSSPSLFRSG